MLPLAIDHVALAVADLDSALYHFRTVWGLVPSAREHVEDQGVEEALVSVGDSALQLVAPTGPDSTVARFIAKRGEGLHHIAFEVDDLTATLDELRAQGVELIDSEPRRGGGGRWVAFVHPRASHGVLLELIQRRDPRRGADD
jgi:methylmalonyl-CoA/ethylmalonyl-CoA epimerase